MNIFWLTVIAIYAAGVSTVLAGRELLRSRRPASGKRVPTDLQILEAIYDQYYSDFTKFVEGPGQPRAAKIYMPIDMDLVGKILGVDGDIIFGRLYYHFRPKYSHEVEQFFTLSVGSEPLRNINCIQFPYMASVLAELQEQERKHRLETRISWLSLAISLAAALTSVLSVLISVYKPE
jgi:hypothetical protein